MKTITPDMHEEVNAKILKLKEYNPVDEFLREYSDHYAETKMLYKLPQIEGFPILQGGGTDGKYLYMALVSVKVNDHQNGLIVKLDPQSGKVLAQSKVLEIDHANDITYDDVRGRLVVVHNAPRAGLLSLIDPETMEETDVVDIGMHIFSMNYNAKRNCYVVGKSGGQDFAVLDADFKPIKHFTAVNTRYVTQGVTSDDDFIYFVQHCENVIMKYDWDGNFVEYIPMVNNKGKEPESLSIIGGKIYSGHNTWEQRRFAVPEVAEVTIKEKQ